MSDTTESDDECVKERKRANYEQSREQPKKRQRTKNEQDELTSFLVIGHDKTSSENEYLGKEAKSFECSEFDLLEDWLEKYPTAKYERFFLNDLLPEEFKSNAQPAEWMIVYDAMELFLSIPSTDEPSIQVFHHLQPLEFETNTRHNRFTTTLVDGKEQGNLVHDLTKVPFLAQLRKQLSEIMNVPDMKKDVAKVHCFRNTQKYPRRCGISLHGEQKHKRMWTYSCGTAIPFACSWFQDNQAIGNYFEVILPPDTLCLMNGKMIGSDWRKSKFPTLRHCINKNMIDELSKKRQKETVEEC